MAPTSTASTDNSVLESASSWWKFARSGKKKPSPTRGATPLAERCMKAYGWNEEYTLRVLAGYRQFIELKYTMEDWDGSALAPSSPIGKMWLLHALDTKYYEEDCQLLCGDTAHFDPNAATDAKVVMSRITTTMHSLKTKFGRKEIDDEIWSCFDAPLLVVAPGTGTTGTPGTRKVRMSLGSCNEDDNKYDFRPNKRTKKATPTSQTRPPPTTPSSASQSSAINTMTISLKDWENGSSYFKVNGNALVGNIKTSYAKFKETEQDNLIFFYDGCPIMDDQTVTSLGIKDGDEIEVSLETEPLENVFDTVDILEEA